MVYLCVRESVPPMTPGSTPRYSVFPPPPPARRDAGLIPAGLTELVDLSDPDLIYVIAAAEAMRDVGLDVEDAAVFQLAVDLGHKRAAEALDDTDLQPEVE